MRDDEQEETIMHINPVHDREIAVMLDSGATNAFVADRLVTQLGWDSTCE